MSRRYLDRSALPGVNYRNWGRHQVLTIRRDQFAFLEQAALEEWLGSHLDSHFPQLRLLYPGERFRRFICDGITRAQSYGFHSGPHVTHWLNLMALLGPTFDEDPSNDWAPAILNQSESPSVKIRALIRAAELKVWGATQA